MFELLILLLLVNVSISNFKKAIYMYFLFEDRYLSGNLSPMRRFMAKANNDKSTEKWQSKKSALMRDRIVVGALECIVQFGYENTTMAKIAKMAKVSPGAMQYHFGSKLEAIKAAIDHLHSVRLAQHHRALQEVPEGFNPIDYTYDLYWAQLNEDHFIAYQDLVIAARTDPGLANVLNQRIGLRACDRLHSEKYPSGRI